MKVYNLSCENHHRFEGWFSSEDDFNEQSRTECIACPVCESTAVRKIPAAPHLNLSGAPPAPQPDAAARLQAQIMQMVRHAVASSEDVGDRFAEEARRIHYNEAPERAIRGVASVQEYAALSEEGIEVLPVPASLKQTLQ